MSVGHIGSENRGLLSTAMRPGLLAIFAGSSGLTVANNYTNQALLGLFAHDFTLSVAMVTIIPVVTQLGNAAGIIFISPLGDRLERRMLIVATMLALTVALAAAAVAPRFAWLVAASLAIGVFAAVTTQIIPFAMHLAAPQERGRVLGLVTAGVLAGILLARTFAGTVSEMWGWRAVFWSTAGLTLAMTAFLASQLPRAAPASDFGYFQLLRSMWTLLERHRPLRRVVTVQALIFAAFMGFWSNLAILFQQPAYRLGPAAVGLMALFGVAGVFVAPFAGRFADRRGSASVASAGAIFVIVAFAILGFIPNSLTAMVVAVLVMDVGVQAAQVANQARVFAFDPAAGSRLNTIFSATMIFGGACGAGAGGLAYATYGWSGTCAFGAVSSGLALILART